MTSFTLYDDAITEIYQQFPTGLGFVDLPIEAFPKEIVSPKKIYLLGDSLTEQSFDALNTFPFGGAMAHVFRRRADVVNRGLSGYSSKWMGHQIQRMLNEFAQLEPDQLFMVFIFVGTNDSILEGNPHNVPLPEYKMFLTDLVTTITKAYPKTAVLLVTPPPCSLKMINSPGSKISSPGTARSNESVQKYVKVVQTVATESTNPLVQLVDLHTELTKTGYPVETFLSDGLHLNGNGYKALFVTVFNSLRSIKEHLLPLQMVEPHFSAKIPEQ